MTRRLSSHSASSMDASQNRLVESGGEPYRLIFHRQGEEDDGQSSTKYGSLPFDQPETMNVTRNLQLRFTYGEQVVVGPYKPTNVGSLTCPNSKLCASLLDDFESEMVSKSSKEFETVRAATEVRFGECEGAGKTLALQFPPWEEWGCWNEIGDASPAKRVDEDAQSIPFPHNWSPRTRTGATVKVCWTVDGIAFVPYEEERANGEMMTESTQIETAMQIDLPLRLARLSNGAGLKAPKVMAIGHDAMEKVALALSFYAPFDPANFQHAVRFYADGFVPVLKTKEGSTVTMTGSTMPEATAQITISKSSLTSAQVSVDSTVQHNSIEQRDYTLELPGTEAVLPGKIVYLRPELRRKDASGTFRVVSYGPCSPVRLTPPPPSQNPRSAANQVLMFTDRHTRVEDYQALKQACTLLQLEPVFLDIERFRDEQGRIHANAWALQKGASTLVWVPTASDHWRLPAQQLEEHVRGGGGLVTNLSLPSIYGSLKTVMADDAVSLAFTEADPVQDTTISNQVVGKMIWPIVYALIQSRHPAAQLAMLSQIPQKMELVVGTVQAEKHVYGSAGGGCCGGCFERGGSCYAPEKGWAAPLFRAGGDVGHGTVIGNTRVTVREALLASFATHLAQERWAAGSGGSAQSHPYTDALLGLASKPASQTDAVTCLGLMEEASLHAWTSASSSEDADTAILARERQGGVCAALKMCNDKSQPFLAIKVAWLQCRTQASVSEALELCSRLKAVRAALQNEQARAAGAQRARRALPQRLAQSDEEQSAMWNLLDDSDDDYEDED